MKHSKFALTMAAALAALGFQHTASATEPFAGGSGNVSIGNNIKGNFSVGSNGSATSYAHNSELASAKITATASHTPNFSSVNAGISGATTTESFGKAYNVSTGSGTGSASSAGSASADVNGKLGIHGVTTGFNGGGSGTTTSNAIHAGTNQGSYVAGQTVSGFDVEVNYSKQNSYVNGGYSKTVTVSDSKTGYASGNNSYGALEGMNAAGVANIGADGWFFAKTRLQGQTGTVSAP